MIFLILLISYLIITFNHKNSEADKDKQIVKTKINNSNEDNNNESNYSSIDYTNYITTESEDNSNIIAEYLSDGMTMKNFEQSLSRTTKYLEKTKQKYNPIEYNFENHLKYEELENIYKELNKSEAVNIEIIGKSYDGRNIYSIEIGYGKEKALFERNIHAAEIASALFLTKFAINIVNDYESQNNEIKELIQNKKIIIVPTINPDSYDYSIFGKDIINDKNSFTYENADVINRTFYKANINGVDLNRNFPSQTAGLYFKDYNLYYTVSRKKALKN